MMIEFTDEQSMLLETATEFCRNHGAIEKVRRDIEAQDALDVALWQSMVELGWHAIAVPEVNGGLGLGLDSVVPVMEAMGRQLLGTPLLSTNLATQALLHGDNEEASARWLPNIAAGSIATVATTEEEGSWRPEDVSAEAVREGDTLTLSGIKAQVLDAEAAELILVAARLDGDVVLLPVPQVSRDRLTREVVIDETRRSYRLDLDGLTVPANDVLKGNAVARTEAAALLLLSAEMAGGLQGALATIVDYLNTRKQFDRFIGSYQALKHPTVDILLASEAARGHVYHAATLWANDDPGLEVGLRMAKAHASEAFAYAGDRAVQFHGGMGFTFECDAQLYLRRAVWSQHQFGDERHHRQLLAPLLLDGAA